MDQKVSEMLLNQRYWDIFTVTDNCSVKKAIRMMDEKKIGALLVHCPESNNPQDLTGILTERDIIELLSRSDEDLDNFKVKDIMSENIISVTSSQTAEEALALMIENQIRHLAAVSYTHLTLPTTLRV